jgi:hypothetical protein
MNVRPFGRTFIHCILSLREVAYLYLVYLDRPFKELGDFNQGPLKVRAHGDQVEIIR